MPRTNLVSRLTLVLMGIGFVYSGVATVRGYHAWFQTPAPRGSLATVDGYLQTVKVEHAETLVAAVKKAGWDADSDVIMVAKASAVSNQTLTQVYYATSYLLSPRRVWLRAWCDPAATTEQCAAVHGVAEPFKAGDQKLQHLVVVGGAIPFSGPVERTHISSELTLVDLPWQE